jgi:IS5 family transposase
LSKEVTIDVTTQEKYTTFPTDFKLITAAIAFILRLGVFLKINFPKIFVKERKDLKSKINFDRSKMALEKKTEYINRLREIGNMLLKQLRFSLPKYYWKLNPITKLMGTLEKAISQKRNSKNKIYSICEPHISCIVKGKAGVPYEFGTKVSFAISTAKIIFLAAVNFIGNPYDGDTIEPTLKQIESMFDGYNSEQIIGDRGYRGRDNIEDVKVFTPYSMLKDIANKLKRILKSSLKRRTVIEPLIGHLKNDHKLCKNFIHGVFGDIINSLLAASAFNFKKLARNERDSLCKITNALHLPKPPRKNKFRGLPIWRNPGPLFD